MALLNLLLGQVKEQVAAAARAQAAQLQVAMAQQRAQLQVARFRSQAEAANKETRLDPDIADLADHFDLEESLARHLHAVMQGREDTFEADMLTLWDVLENAKDPSETLQEKIEELVAGTFVAKTKTHNDVVKFCKKYELDHMATKNLIEALAVRERDHETNTSRDLERLAVHMEHSSAPSKLISMKLKEIRGGCNIGAVWHCCGDSKKRGREKVKEPPPDGGPGIEGVQRQRQGTYKSYTDKELQQRFTSGGGGRERSEGLMTEEQAMNFTRKMRRHEEEEEEDHRQGRSGSRSRPRRHQRRHHSRSRSRARRRMGSRDRSRRRRSRRRQ